MSDGNDENTQTFLERSHHYKEYVVRGTETAIPKSTWYRYQQKYKEKQQDVIVSTDEIESMDIDYDNSTQAESSHLEYPKEEMMSKVSENSSSTDESFETFPKVVQEEIDVYERSENGTNSPTMTLTTDTKITENVLQKMYSVIEELGDDIHDDIECEASTHNLTEDEEDEDLLINFEEASNVNDQYIPSEAKYNTLEDMISAPDFNEPVNTSVKATMGEIVIMIVRYALINALTLTAIYELFRLINSIFWTPILPNTKYFIDKLFYPKNVATFHGICKSCDAYAGIFNPKKDGTIRCQHCNAVVNVKKYAFQDFFVTMDLTSPITELIQSNAHYFDFVMNSRLHRKGCVDDIYDGKLYRDFVKSLDESDKHQYATATFNTDGAPLFESSTCSMWPIYLMINELPYNIRSKELVLAGLWIGKDKPNMNVFLTPFVDNMNKLSLEGIPCNFNGIERHIKIFSLVCCVDSVARAPMQGFVQYNAYHGCSICLHPGEYVKQSAKQRRGGCIKYPILHEIPKLRNLIETRVHCETATIKNPVFGVKLKSSLMNLNKFDLIQGCVPDGLHLCTGIAKQFAKMWFGTKKKAGLLPLKVVEEVDQFLNNIKSPSHIKRLTRPLSEKQFWKAREWENWIFYYSIPILLRVLPLELTEHWALFVEAFYVLSEEKISVAEIDRADELLHNFVADTQRLYSKVAMTFNIHSLLHLARSVYDWGPLPTHNAFAFESGHVQLLKGINSAKGIHHQICRRISLQYSMLKLNERVNLSFHTKHFLTYVGTNKVQKSVNISTPTYFGPPSRVSSVWMQNLPISDSSASFYKMVKDGCLFLSSTKSNERSDNTYAMLSDNSYVRLKYFIVDRRNGMEYSIVQKINVINGFDQECSMLKSIVKIIENESAILTSMIVRVCVHVKLKEYEYLCAVPNMHSY